MVLLQWVLSNFYLNSLNLNSRHLPPDYVGRTKTQDSIFILTLPLTSFSQCLSFSNKTDTEGMFLQCQSWLNGLFQSVLSFLTRNIFHALIIDLSLHFPICITNFEMEEQKHNSISNKISPSKYSGVAVFFCSFFLINPNIQMFFDGS